LDKFCLDTSVLLDNTKVIESLGASEIVIPFCVLSELDGKRHSEGSLGKNAREIVRKIDEILHQDSSENNSFSGVRTEQGGLLRIANSDHEHMPTNDLKIVETARIEKAIILSNDIGLRIQAKGLGLDARGFAKAEIQEDIFHGPKNIHLPKDMIEKLHQDNCVPIDSFTTSEDNFYPNQSFIITDLEEGRANTLARYSVSTSGESFLQKVHTREAFGVKPANAEQHFALELLLDTNVELMSLVGRAGSGKTFLVVAAGLEQVVETHLYERIIVLRPIVSVGNRDIGYLPGTDKEKLAPWIQPVRDNLMQLLNNKKSVDLMFEDGTIDVQHIGYIRGRSIPRSYIIVDECQNITVDELKTILTRVAVGSKVVLTGDIEQIDNKRLDIFNNGLTRVISGLAEESITGHVVLEKCHRSKLAALAATKL
jgi:PhoH-like ATPase